MRSLHFIGISALALLAATQPCFGQLDPMFRNQIQLGYDQPLSGKGPQAAYAYYYYNDPEFIGTNLVLRAAVAPAYIDSELGFRSLLSPNTDLGIGVVGGLFGDNFYEVRQGTYRQEESFDGHGGGLSLGVYHRINPDQTIPLSAVAKGGVRYSAYDTTDRTAPGFVLPEDRYSGFARGGLRFAGKEPVLYPDLALELSVWYEREWRFSDGAYGFANDRSVRSSVGRYWAYAGLDYAWTNTGHKASFAVTAGGSSDADRFSAWRLGGVLPLVAEFPLILPGYYYQELTAERFVHLFGSYVVSLDSMDRWQIRFEAASAAVESLPGFQEPSTWHTGAGTGVSYTSRRKVFKVVARYGYGFNARRSSGEGSHSVGLLLQWDFERWRQVRHGDDPK
jgi:hypothetical protein